MGETWRTILDHKKDIDYIRQTGGGCCSNVQNVIVGYTYVGRAECGFF